MTEDAAWTPPPTRFAPAAIEPKWFAFGILGIGAVALLLGITVVSPSRHWRDFAEIADLCYLGLGVITAAAAATIANKRGSARVWLPILAGLILPVAGILPTLAEEPAETAGPEAT